MLLRHIQRNGLFDVHLGTLPVAADGQRVGKRIVREQQQRPVLSVARRHQQLFAQLHGRTVFRPTMPVTPQAVNDREQLWSVSYLLAEVSGALVRGFDLWRSPADRA